MSGGDKSTRKVGAKVPSVLLALTGIAIVAIQTYIFVSYGEFASSYAPFNLYNGMAMASGTVSCLAGILCLCCTTTKRSPSSLCVSIFLAVLAAIGSIGSAVLTTIESSRLRNLNDHPCSSLSTSIDCNLWFDLQVSVAALSVFSFVLSLILTIVISIALSKSKKTIKRSQSARLERPPVLVVQEMEHIPSSHPVVVMPVIVEEVYKEMEPEPEPIPEPEPVPEPDPNTIIGRQPYIEQLKMMSREELERRLGEHMQHQFLEELRTELNRRNLIPINGRPVTRSASSSTKSRDGTVPAAPQPDYYQEPL